MRPQREDADVVIVPLGETRRDGGAAHRRRTAREGVAADMAFRGNMKKRMSRANEAGAAYALIIGDDELDRGEAQLKDLASGEQRAVSLDLLAEALAR